MRCSVGSWPAFPDLRFGISIPNFAEPERLVEVACAVEQHGWDGFFL
jgi:hypothetical protein